MPNRFISEGLLDLVVDVWPKLNARFAIMRAAYSRGSVNPFAVAFDNINMKYKMARPVIQYLWACSTDKIPANISEMCRQLDIKSRSNANDIIRDFKAIGVLDENLQPTDAYLAMCRQRILAVLNEPVVKSFVLSASAFYLMRRVDSLEDMTTEACLWQDGVPDAISQKDVEALISSGFGQYFDPSRFPGSASVEVQGVSATSKVGKPAVDRLLKRENVVPLKDTASA